MSPGLAEKVRSDTGVNITWSDFKCLDIALEDASKWADVIWSIIEKQAAEAGVTSETFRFGFYGTSSEAARTALGEAIADWFPFAPTRLLYLEAVRKLLAGQSTDSLLPMNAPESAESIPESLACAN